MARNAGRALDIEDALGWNATPFPFANGWRTDADLLTKGLKCEAMPLPILGDDAVHDVRTFHNGKIAVKPDFPLCLATTMLHGSKIADMEKIGTKRAVRLFLREWREKRGLTQGQLAERMDTTSGTISKKEGEPEKVDIGWLNRFAAGLDVDVSELFHHPDRPTPNDLLRAAAANVPDDRAAEVIDLLEVFARRRA